MKEKIKAYIARLREKASHTSAAHRSDWAVEQERCDVYDEVADALEEILMEEEESEVRKAFEVYDALESVLPERK